MISDIEVMNSGYEKKFKRSIAILLCFTMVFNCSFSVLADENVESSEPVTTYTETTEPMNSEDVENIEESENDEEEVLDDFSEEIEKLENDNEDTEEAYEEELEEDIKEELDEEVEKIEVASPSEIIDEEGEEEDSIPADIAEEPEEEIISNEIMSEKIEEATLSEIKEIIDEEIINDATASEIEEVIDEKYVITVYFLTDMKLKDRGNGGSYNYSWDTFLIDKNQEFNIDEKIPEVIKHSSCEQEYTLVGFTTENQIDTLWKGADYAGGVYTLDKNFIVDSDMEIFAVYEAKDTYISAITIDNEIIYKTTTIPNKAIKNILVLDNKDEIYDKNDNVKYYKIKNSLDDINYMFTKDSSEGKPIKVEDFSLEKYKNSR